MQLVILFAILVGFTVAFYTEILNLSILISVILAHITWILIVLIYWKSRFGRKLKKDMDEYEKVKEKWLDERVKEAKKRGFFVKEQKKK